MLDRYLELDSDDEGFEAAVAWLKAKGLKPASITDETREAFVDYVAEKYFRMIKRAIKKHDPHHMYLGCRFHGKALSLKPLFKAAAAHVDILSINWHWHRYMDNDPEAGEDPSDVDSNKGIVTCKYEPHEDLIAEMKRVNMAVYHLRNSTVRSKSTLNNQ
ncbi:hypothetical protein ACFL6U_19605 [Planctomycetota bacterium]